MAPASTTSGPAHWPDANALHQDLATLTSWLLEGPYTSEDIVERIRKPWNYLEELDAARAGADPYQEPGP